MESSSMFVELEDFGQTDLTRRIREVLLNTDSEGTTVRSFRTPTMQVPPPSDSAWTALCRLTARTHDLPKQTPHRKQFEILIRFHFDANRPLRVFYVHQKMKKFNVKPRVFFLYNRIIDALMRNGYVDLGVSVYDDFRNDGLVVESVTFIVLIKGLCKVGRIDEMLKVLSKMRENLCTPDVVAYMAMVRVLVEAGNLDGCLRVWEEMKKDKVELDAMAYTTLVTALC
ncbi:pentatricopeptide repeat-containing protein [Quercus suber]|uniref:Pentatricopeptide repeat-containing protein n=1 Tax=Quercus suber TaxID=58331 RepID=A0AAW0KZW7_QUESU